MYFIVNRLTLIRLGKNHLILINIFFLITIEHIIIQLIVTFLFYYFLIYILSLQDMLQY